MRRKIFDIYKALRRFDVTAEEVNEIAEGYKHWLNNPVEKFPPYGTVYSVGNKLYSLPYAIPALYSKCVGIEIGKIIYFARYAQDVPYCELEGKMARLKFSLTEKFKIVNQLKLRLPTKEEAQVLLEKTRIDDALNFFIGNRYGEVWITPDPDCPKNTIATVGMHMAEVHCPSDDSRAILYFVACPEEQISFGKVDNYGTLTPDTLAMYRELSDSLY